MVVNFEPPPIMHAGTALADAYRYPFQRLHAKLATMGDTYYRHSLSIAMAGEAAGSACIAASGYFSGDTPRMWAGLIGCGAAAAMASLPDYEQPEDEAATLRAMPLPQRVAARSLHTLQFWKHKQQTIGVLLIAQGIKFLESSGAFQDMHHAITDLVGLGDGMAASFPPSEGVSPPPDAHNPMVMDIVYGGLTMAGGAAATFSSSDKEGMVRLGKAFTPFLFINKMAANEAWMRHGDPWYWLATVPFDTATFSYRAAGSDRRQALLPAYDGARS